jgi:hypothetical protein
MRHVQLRRRGNAMIYAVIIMPALVGVISLAVDLGRAQMVKAELQRAADATARGYLALQLKWGPYLAGYYSQLIPGANPTDALSGKQPVTTIETGWWNASTKQFILGPGSPFAVRVTMSRKGPTNGVQLPFASMLGRGTVDIEVKAVAALNGTAWEDVEVSAMGDPWLAGMPAGSNASGNDYAGPPPTGQSPLQISVPVVPGSYVEFRNVDGLARHGPTLADSGADGAIGTEPYTTHREGAQNGIGDVRMPINAMVGVFLDDTQPNYSPAPTAMRDYSTAAERDKPIYNDLQKKQPFFIGDGKTPGGSYQRFLVPPGVTRLYVGIMDGYEWMNNVGKFSARVQVNNTISLVQ